MNDQDFFYNDATAPSGLRPPHYLGFAITLPGHITLGRTPLEEWPARHRNLYLTTQIHKRKKSMTPAGFEPTVPASELPQNRAATGTGND